MNNESKKLTVISPIYGVNFNSEKPIKFERFTIYRLPDHHALILKEMPKFDFVKQPYEKSESYLISIEIVSKEPSIAIEEAIPLFEGYASIINFLVGDLHLNYDVNMSKENKILKPMIKVLSKTGEAYASGSGLHHFINLDSEYNKSSINREIWKYFFNTKSSNVEKRIINSISWIGRAVVERDSGKALVEYILGLEALLVINFKTQISPSIGQQLSEGLAFLINDSKNERLATVKMFKHLYRLRSEIVHTGISNVTRNDIEDAYNLSFQAVINFITGILEKKYKNIDDFYSWVQGCKFE